MNTTNEADPTNLVNPAAILRPQDAQRHVALSRSSIYARLAENDFPKPIRLGPRAIGWLKSELDEWLASRPRSESRTMKP
ncbi:MAG: AlpA family phage regulatory protein [Nitrospira sp.]